MLILLIIIPVLLFLALEAFFSGSETAIISANKMRLRALADRGNDRAKLANRLLKRPERPALGRLDEIKVPTLIVVGEYDIPDVHAHAGVIEAGIPESKRVVLNNCAHHVPTEQPDVLNKLIEKFLKEKK